jgi:hypothetical protein
LVPTAATTSALLERYAGVLLDVYGVLLDGSGALPGARELISELDSRGVPYAIVTNDASRSIATYVQRFARFGLTIAGERIITSGSLLPDYFAAKSLAGTRVCVLGTDDSAACVLAAGGDVVKLGPGLELDVLAHGPRDRSGARSAIPWPAVGVRSARQTRTASIHPGRTAARRYAQQARHDRRSARDRHRGRARGGL